MKKLIQSAALITVSATLIACTNYKAFAQKYPSHVLETQRGMTKAEIIKLWGREPNEMEIRRNGDLYTYIFGTGDRIKTIGICFSPKTGLVDATTIIDKKRRISSFKLCR